MPKLSDVKLRRLKPHKVPRQFFDGGGLYAEVLPSGSISFRYGYRLYGKREKVTLGSYPALSLKAARQQHRRYQTMVEHGESPARQKQADRASRKAHHLATNTVEAYARQWLTDWRVGKSERAVAQAEAWLAADVYPVIGKRPVSQVEEVDLIDLLDRIKRRGAPQTARRVLGYLKGIFKYAKRRGAVKYNPAQSITADEIAAKSERDRALEPDELARFLRALDISGAEERTRLALRLVLLTLCRKDELRLARWEHVDLQRAEWLVPWTKSGKPHVVYLSRQTLEAFTRLKELAADSPFVLRNRDRISKPMSHMALNKLIDSLLGGPLKGMLHFTVHDLRRTASTRLHEQGYAPDVIEMALGHRIGGVRGVYNRAKYAEQRREMLQQWADYIDRLTGNTIVEADFAKAA